jgi:hypothetical protein
VFWADIALAGSAVLFALHEAEHISEHKDVAILRSALIEVIAQQLTVTLWVV